MGRTGIVLGLLCLALAPVGAGATGHASLAMLAFAGVFFLANAVIRPGEVRLKEPGTLALQAVTAGAFAALLVGFGQTLRALGQIGTEVSLEPWLVLAAWGAVLVRLFWTRHTGERAAKRAETALRVVHGAGAPKRAPTPKRGRDRPALRPVEGPETAAASPPPIRPAPMRPAPRSVSPESPALREALARLDELPETGTSESALGRALSTVSGAAPLDAVYAALSVRAGLSERDRRALVLHATDPWVAERQAGKAEPAKAFEDVVAAADAVALTDFATRALALIDEITDARHDMPPIQRLLEIADQIEDSLETESELLIALAHRLEDLAIDAEHGGDD